jgi:endonuclease III
MTDIRISKKERERMERILEALNKEYSEEYHCFLNYETPWQLLIATILSAQCTDNRVNIVTKDLFLKYKSLKDFAHAEQEELEKDIHSTGFYKNKSKNIIACAKQLVEKYNGEVLNDLEVLTNLPGVGRKTANVIRGNIYHEPCIVVDTHVKRISNRLGFTKEEDPVKIEFDLMCLLPKEQWILYNIQIITLGRSICMARSPKCKDCFLRNDCNFTM